MNSQNDLLQCAIQIPELVGSNSDKKSDTHSTVLTVGRKFLLNCSGAYNSSFNFQKAQLVLNEDQKYILQFIKVSSIEENKLSIEMVSYQAGQFADLNFALTDGQEQIGFVLSTLKVDSVLTEEQQNLLKQGQEVPSNGFLFSQLDWPITFISIFSFLILIIFTLSILVFRRKRKMNELMKGLQKFNSAVSPDSQFYRTVRNLEKNNQLTFSDLNQALKLYLTRRFQIPFVEMKDKEALKMLCLKIPLEQKTTDLISRRLNELKSLSLENSKNDSVVQYLPKIYRLVDQIESLKT